MRWSASTALWVFALGFGTVVQAAPEIPCCSAPCPAPFNKLLSDEIFSRYPAPYRGDAVQPVAPKVKTGRAHLYRTVIREEAKQGPNFASHFTIARIGCGAATVCPAIVDVKTGSVYFPSELLSAEALLMDTGDTEVDTLNYRRSSRLLIVAGTPNENRRKEGMSYYLWRSGKLMLIRFIPSVKLCVGS